ncbi:SAICAR synthase-like protein [Xylariomycetidae sp. FL0641]|nr:SAICAR synthase-like protein [Xylariomycetidae sp. FL0641]
MPSFVNDENSPVYAHHPGVVHLQGHPEVPFSKFAHADEKPLGTRMPTIQPSDASFDDNSSEQSSASSAPRYRMNGLNGVNGVNGASPPPSSMTPWPNGRPGKSPFPTSPGKPSPNVNAPSRTPPVPPEFTRQPTSDSLPRSQRQSGESAFRTPMPLPSPRESDRRPMSNGDTTPMMDGPGAGSFPFPSEAPANENAQFNPSLLHADKQTPAAQRFSSPANLPATSASTSALQPPTPGIRQRHTLEVPKVHPARNSKDSNDAAFASGRFSPTGAGPSGRRNSANLPRRPTRSMQSDMPRDEIMPDDDALRWAEAYRQKRAKKKRREEEDEDRVLVGTKVDENHANFTTAYNMLTGIRVSVSRTNAKLDRPLTDADFEAKQKSTFDIAGNELVPSAKYDFKFKDYAPWVFRHLRALFRLDPADYLMSLTGKYILSELGSPGKSGSFFYFSRDYKYIIKTIHHAEHKFLRKILKDYYNHVTDNPNTLLSQFYGLHRVKMPYGKKIHFVVMNNLFPPHRDIHTTFDLKGSTVGRDYREEDLEKNPRATLKDLNWLRRKRHLELGLQKKHLFMAQLQNDVRLLQKLKIMDYSLLVGIHDLRKGNEENLRDKTLQVFNPGGDGPADEPDPASVLMRTPSKMESARKAKELRNMIKSERPKPVGETSDRMPDELAEGYSRGGLFYNDDGGIRATHEDNTVGEEVYYLGVIDCLTHYGMIKKVEHFWKGLSNDRSQISALPPQEYGDRFLKFMSGITMTAEEAERDAHDREMAAAVAAADAAAQEENEAGPRASGSHSAPAAPTYLPPAPPGMRDPKSPPPNPTVEKALQMAIKSEKDIAKEEQVPERKITTALAPATTKNNSPAVLPIVEESAEAASLGGRSHGERSMGSRPFTPQRPERQDGFTELGPHGIGGRGPPTPPKSSYIEPEPDSFSTGRQRSGSGNGSFMGMKMLRGRVSRESLDKALPALPH